MARVPGLVITLVMTTITLLHTSPAHVPTFKALADEIAPHARLVQIVRQDWLEQAIEKGVQPGLRDQIGATIQEADGKVICTCTTLGPAAVDAGAIRIDAPMMQQAARLGGQVLLVYALGSTAGASRGLLEQAFAEIGEPATITPLYLGAVWPLFEAGAHAAFAAQIADAGRDKARGQSFAAVVLAQASMAGAALHLQDLDVPVLTSPRPALEYCLKRFELLLDHKNN